MVRAYPRMRSKCASANDARLQRGVELAEGQHDRRGAQRGELLDQDLGIHDPEALAFERGHRPERLVRGEVLPAVGPDGDGLEPALVEGGQHGLPHFAGADLLGLLAVGRIEERNIKDGGDRIEAAKEGGGGHRSLDRAELDAFVHLAGLTKLARGKEREFNLAAGSRLDQLGNALQRLVTRLERRFEMTDLRSVFCGRCGQSDARRGAKEQRDCA